MTSSEKIYYYILSEYSDEKNKFIPPDIIDIIINFLRGAKYLGNHVYVRNGFYFGRLRTVHIIADLYTADLIPQEFWNCKIQICSCFHRGMFLQLKQGPTWDVSVQYTAWVTHSDDDYTELTLKEAINLNNLTNKASLAA